MIECNIYEYMYICIYIYPKAAVPYSRAQSYSRAAPYSQAHLISGPQLIPTLFPGTKWGRIFCGSLSKLVSSYPPTRVKGGWELRAKLHFTLIRGIRGVVPAGHFFCAGIALATQLLGIGHPISLKT